MNNGRLTDESQEEVSIDCVDQEIQSIVPDESTTSATVPSKDRASGQTKNSSSHNSKTHPPLGATASFPSKTENILGQKVQTVDGQFISAGEGYASLVRIKKTPIPGDDNAYICNVLPTPALGVYNNILPPMEKVGRFIKYPEKKDIQDRHETYIRYRWPLELPSPEDLATAGMFYIGLFYDEEKKVVIKDQVVCYKCGKALCGWEEDDNPLREHFKHFPECFQENWIEKFCD